MSSSKKNNLTKYIKKVYKDLNYENKDLIKKLDSKLKENKPIIYENDYDYDDLFLNALTQTNDYTFEVYFLKEDIIPIKLEKDVIGIKSIKINAHVKNDLMKFVYQMYYTRHLKKTFSTFFNYYKNDLKQFQIFYNKDIYIKVIIKKKLKLNVTSREEYTYNYVKYVPQNAEESYISATLLFNQNSIEFLKYQDLKYYLHNKHIKNWDLMEYFRNSMNNILPIDSRFRLMFHSSTILYFIGHRPNNDFDVMIYCKPNEPEFYARFREFEKIENEKHINENPKGMYDFLYINSGNANIEKPFYNDYTHVWAQTYGAQDFNEVRAYGKYHMYYLGIKSTTIFMDIIKRRLRARPRSLADLIALRIKYGFKFTIPAPLEFVKMFYKVKELNKNKINNLIKKGGILKKNHNIEEIQINEPIDMGKFYKTIQWALKTRYHIIMSIEEIQKNFVKNNSNNKLLKFELKMEENDTNKNEKKKNNSKLKKSVSKSKSKSKSKSISK